MMKRVVDNRKKSPAGFTVVEFLLTALLVAILSTVMALFMNQSLDLYTAIRVRGEAVYKANYALERILNGAMLIATPSTQIATATTTQFKFTHPVRGELLYKYTANENPDGTGNLYEQPTSTGVASLLASEIASGFKFTYYKNGGPRKSNNTTSTPSEIAYVEIKMAVSTNSKFGSVTVEQGAYLRNKNYVNFTQP